MSLKTLLGFGRRLLRAGKKESALPATGQQQKQITYTPKPSQASGQELATREIRNPPVVLNQTQPLHMGEKVAPAFGSSTYDWVMKKGRGQYTADEWLDHLTSSREIKFKVFGKPAKKTIAGVKSFKYDRGPFAGKEVNVSKEELFDSNLAVFNAENELTGGLLYAAKKFGLKLDANTVGNMIKLNPINRLKTFQTGVDENVTASMFNGLEKSYKQMEGMRKKYRDLETSSLKEGDIERLSEIESRFGDAMYAIQSAIRSKNNFNDLAENSKKIIQQLKGVRDLLPDQQDFKEVNKLMGEFSERFKPIQGINKPKYYNNEQTLMGGQGYREVVFYLDEAIPGNSQAFRTGSHFGGTGPVRNELYHVRFDTRFTPEGKKVLSIHQIQSDVAKTVSDSLTKAEQLGGIKRINPFQADIERKLFMDSQRKISDQLSKALAADDATATYRLADDLTRNTEKITQLGRRAEYDYFPMVDADQYSDHALKYLMRLAAREGADYVAVLPFDMLNYKASSSGWAGNEKVYGYASGKGINKKGKALIPELMKKAARFYNSKAGPIKLSRSDPKLPYKRIEKETYTYKTGHAMEGKKFERISHSDARADNMDGYTFMESSDPRLYFDAFAIKVNPLMRNTQKTYKSEGGLVVDMFKPIRYN